MNGITVTTNTQAALSPVALFLHADIVVKIVMIGLLLASLWTWTIIFGRGGVLRRADRESAAWVLVVTVMPFIVSVLLR